MYTFGRKYSTQGVHMSENDGGDKMGEKWNQVGDSEGVIVFFRKTPKSACVWARQKAQDGKTMFKIVECLVVAKLTEWGRELNRCKL